jgi:hypothetical protein
MSNLLDRLSETTKKETLPQNEVSKQLNPSAQYALTKVMERMLGGNKAKQATKWEDNYYFTLLDQNEALTDQEQAILDAAKADLCLVSTHKNLLRTMTHLQLEEYWNLIGEKERAATTIVKKYWLGSGFEVNINNVRSVDEIAKRISDRVIDDVVSFYGKYKAFQENSEKRDMAVLPIKGDKVNKIDKGTWSDRVYYGWSKVGMDKSTYLNNLLVSLYQNQSIPANIPLTEFEREAILDKLGFKNTKNNTAKKEAA